MVTAAPRNNMDGLLSRPIPATTPNQTQSRVFPVLMMRIRKYAHSPHQTGSVAARHSMFWAPSHTGAIRAASAASPWAKRPPPSSRAIRPTITIVTAPAMAGKKRKANIESPINSRDSRPIQIVSGPIST